MGQKRYSLLASAVLISGVTYSVEANAQVRQFDVPAQSASTGIPLFAHQAGIQVLASGASVDGIAVNRVQGAMEVGNALRILLAGTNLVPVKVGGAFVIRRQEANTPRTAYTPISAQALPAQSRVDAAPAAPRTSTEEPTPEVGQDIVVTGVRQSLERAAAIKRDATQIVDSIVSEDIGKFPDPTTAAALQRVPGVQVAVTQSNEIGDVRIRGLADVMTTLDGREIFSTTGRSFSLNEIPADALSRVNVIKSNTAELIEGGIAGVIDLQFNKPFNFRKPTVVLNARGNYGLYSKRADPQLGVLLTDTWETGIGDIGALLNVTWARTHYNHPRTREGERRSTDVAPYNLPGGLASIVAANNVEYGKYERPQANASIQWSPSNDLTVYLDGFYAGHRARDARSLVTANFYPVGSGITDAVISKDDCITARVMPNGYNPTPVLNRNGTADPADDTYTLPPFQVQNLCVLQSATFTNVITQQNTYSYKTSTDTYLGAAGFEWKADGLSLKGDLSYQQSKNISETFLVGLGKRVAEWQYVGNTGNGSTSVTPGNPLADPNGLVLFNGLDQNFSRSRGKLLAGKLDGTVEVNSFIKTIQFGTRYADRKARFDAAVVNTAPPGGTLGTAGEATATTVASLNLPPEFLALMPSVSLLNNGERGLVPNPDFLRSDRGRDLIRAAYGLPAGDPAYQDNRRFLANERTIAFYAQAAYEIPIGGMTLDGVIGVRPSWTKRTIQGTSTITIPASSGQPAQTQFVPIRAKSSDLDVLPNASARLKIGGGLQARLTYSIAVRRPDFASLNPGLSYALSTNPLLLNSGSAGNPDLRPQRSTNFDASLEYYFPRGFLSVAVYTRDIKDRVISSATGEEIDGVLYLISRPRNVGAASLKGLEFAGQTFFDFLPGALSGLGVFGNFTLSDSKVKGQDQLAGLPLLGVSKYNFNVGLLFEKFGISARAVYTWRSRYYDQDATGSTSLRAIDPARANDPSYNPLNLNYVRPAGRLDLGLSYDVSDRLRVDFGATNVLRNKYYGYYNAEFLPNEYRFDESVYSLGVRLRM